MSEPRNWMVLGAILAGLAVVFGAFGAHGLEGQLTDLYGDEVKTIAGLEVPATYKYLRDFNTGAEYQMYHALGLLSLGIALVSLPVVWDSIPETLRSYIPVDYIPDWAGRAAVVASMG